MSQRRTYVLGMLLLPLLVAPSLLAQVENPLAARDLVLDELLRGDVDGIRIMVHPELIAAGTAVPTWHRTALTTPAQGYVVFIDDFAFANFEHPCRYVFVDKETGALEVTHETTPPRGMLDWLEMETEALRVLMNAKNVRAPRALNPAPPRKTLRGGEFYAILMSGGAGAGSNHVRYWNDLSNIYITLVDVYGYKDENIIVLCSDGLDPTPDQSNGKNSHPDLDGDGDDDIMYSCILSNIQLVFTQMIAELTPDDQLFVFTTDHGGSNGGWNTYLNLWNYEELSDAQLESMMAALPQCNMITTMEQCYSGGFEDNLSNTPGRVFSSACAYNEVSWAMPPDYVYDTYVFFWTAAVKGEDAYGNPCNADANGDGKVSMHEAFLYAEEHDFSDETPQYNSMPTDLGDNLFLGLGPALSILFPDPLPDGPCPPGPETKITLEIKPGYENYVPGSGQLLYRFDPIDPYNTLSLTPLGGDRFEVTLPNTEPGDEPEFYFSALGDGGTTIYSPPKAPAEVYAFEVCFVNLLWEDDFETNKAWTVQSQNILTGEWERADPAGTDAQPEDDHSESGTLCYVTGRLGGSIGNDDVDGGPTRLTSPALDLSEGDAMLFFYLWFYHTDYGTQQPLVVHLSDDGGASWTQAEQVAHEPKWIQKKYKVSDFVTPTSQVMIRITATDQPNDDVVEALVDDFKVERYDYDPALWADAYSISLATGAQINYTLDAGGGHAGRTYLLLGTLSGTSPGITLPGGKIVPINWDVFTTLIVTCLGSPIFQNFLGSLDASGRAFASFNTGPLDPSLLGSRADFAFVLGPPPGWDFVSNNIGIFFDP